MLKCYCYTRLDSLLDCLKALISWEFENKPEGGGGGEGGNWEKH